MATFIDVGSLTELKDRACITVAGADRPIVVFYDDGQVRALDNRCPHMGFPLSKGLMKDGILTCEWHHARFDLCSGCTFDLWADDVATFETRIDDDRVMVATTPKVVENVDYHLDRLRRGMSQNIRLVIAKSIIGLLECGHAPSEVVAELSRFACQHHSNWGTGMTVLTIAGNMCGMLDERSQYFLLVEAASLLAGNCAGAAPPIERSALEHDHDIARLKQWFRQWVSSRHRDGAERTLLSATASTDDDATLTDLIFAGVFDRVYSDTGHVADFSNKAIELLVTVGSDQAANVYPLILPAVLNARGEEEKANWRHPVDLITPLRALEAKLPELLETSDASGEHDLDVATLLGDDDTAIFDALEGAFRAGLPVAQIAQRVTYAAARRLAQFSSSNDTRDWFAPVHTFIFANAVHMAALRAPSADVARGVLHAALSVYVDRQINRPAAKLIAPDRSLDHLPEEAEALQDAIYSALDRRSDWNELAELTTRYLRLGHPPAGLFQALLFATIREDLDFHFIQTLEAGWRQYEATAANDPEIGAHIVAGVVRHLAAFCPTARAGHRTSDVALKLHRGEAIYE